MKTIVMNGILGAAVLLTTGEDPTPAGASAATRTAGGAVEGHREKLEETLKRIDDALVRSKALRPSIERIRREITGLEERARRGEIEVGAGLEKKKSLQRALRDRITEAEAELLVLRNDVEHGVLPRLRAVAESFKALTELQGVDGSRRERHLRLFQRAKERAAHIEGQLAALTRNLERIQRSKASIEAMLSDSELEDLVIDSAGRLAESLSPWPGNSRRQ